MVETNKKDIDIDTIIKKIREEVDNRKAEKPLIKEDNDPFHEYAVQQPVNLDINETKIYSIIKKILATIKRYPFYSIVYKKAYKFKRFIPKYRTSVKVSDLLNYSDEEFIRNAYRIILQREPDPQAWDHYINVLRRGQLTKIGILGRLKYSIEGKQRGIAVKGLLVRYIIDSIYIIPVVGYIFNLLVSIIRFPIIVRNMREYEALTNSRFTQYSRCLNDLSVSVEAKIEQITSNLIDKQKAINAINDIINNELSTKAQVEAKLSTKADIHLVNEIGNELKAIIGQSRDHQMQILDQRLRITLLLDEARKRLPAPLSQEQIVNMVKEEDHLLDAVYAAFEDRFRGTREDIKERVKVYLPYIKQAMIATDNALVLDLGCGRGEWLELLKDTGIVAIGVDLNRVMVQQCIGLGLRVVEADAIAHLKDQPSNSLSAITGFHLIEHLNFVLLVKLFDEALRVLKPGGFALFETPNPENLIVGAYTFHFDPTHNHPLVPETVQFILEQRGFIKIEIVRLHKYSDFHDVDSSLHTAFNDKWFNTATDFTVIGYKS